MSQRCGQPPARRGARAFVHRARGAVRCAHSPGGAPAGSHSLQRIDAIHPAFPAPCPHRVLLRFRRHARRPRADARRHPGAARRARARRRAAAAVARRGRDRVRARHRQHRRIPQPARPAGGGPARRRAARRERRHAADRLRRSAAAAYRARTRGARRSPPGHAARDQGRGARAAFSQRARTRGRRARGGRAARRRLRGCVRAAAGQDGVRDQAEGRRQGARGCRVPERAAVRRPHAGVRRRRSDRRAGLRRRQRERRIVDQGRCGRHDGARARRFGRRVARAARALDRRGRAPA